MAITYNDNYMQNLPPRIIVQHYRTLGCWVAIRVDAMGNQIGKPGSGDTKQAAIAALETA